MATTQDKLTRAEAKLEALRGRLSLARERRRRRVGISSHVQSFAEMRISKQVNDQFSLVITLRQQIKDEAAK